MSEQTWTKAEYDAAGAALVRRLHSRIQDLEDALEFCRDTADDEERARVATEALRSPS